MPGLSFSVVPPPGAIPRMSPCTTARGGTLSLRRGTEQRWDLLSCAAVSPCRRRAVKDKHLVGWTQLPPKTQQTAKVNPPPQLRVRRHGRPCNAYRQLKTAFLSLLKVSSGSNIIYCLIRRAFIFWHFFSRGIISAWEKKPKQQRRSVQPQVVGLGAGVSAGASPVGAAGAQAG